MLPSNPQFEPFTKFGITFNTQYQNIAQGISAMQVLHGISTSCPNKQSLSKIWKEWRKGRAFPLILLIQYGNDAAILGPNEDSEVIYDLNFKKTLNLIEFALQKTSVVQSKKFIQDNIKNVSSETFGLINSGLVANRELVYGLKNQKNWSYLKEKGKNCIGKRGEPLVRELGFEIDDGVTTHRILRVDGSKQAIGIFLLNEEIPDASSNRFDSQSPVLFGLKKADEENLPWLIVLSQENIRLYPTATGIGIGQRGRTETYIDINLTLISEDDIGYLWALFSGEALRTNGLITKLLDSSKNYITNLGSRLRERIYSDVIPKLSIGLANQRGVKLSEELDETYRMSLVELFRILFLAYVEDRGYIRYPPGSSLKEKAKQLLKIKQEGGQLDPSSTKHWDDVQNLVKSIYRGNTEYGIPAYGGSIFADNIASSREGHLLSRVKLPNNVFGEVLRHLLIDVNEDGIEGPIDFRELGIREFGTIYEGLLENKLTVASDDYVVGKNGEIKIAKEGQTATYKKGEIYLINASGKRKSSASYYTKEFAVDHLLDNTVKPALEAHFKRLDSLEENEASKQFFNFRVADISMGSGHFLIAAVDLIAKMMSSYLTQKPLEGVSDELDRLLNMASEKTGIGIENLNIDHDQLLRRQVARRCIYGVDINPMAVELAKMSMWIHTFIPGLPLSLLDLHLKCGNSLVGITSQDKINKSMKGTMLETTVRKQLNDILDSIIEISIAGDESIADIDYANKVRQDNMVLLDTYKSIMDAFLVVDDEKLKGEALESLTGWVDDPESVRTHQIINLNHEKYRKLQSFHFNIEFPEVFFRENPGFDSIIGNPPWDKIKFEEPEFWMRYYPNLCSLKEKDKMHVIEDLSEQYPDLKKQCEIEKKSYDDMRAVINSKTYPGLGVGDVDYSKAFSWRFVNLLRNNGYLGVVLPTSIFNTLGCKDFRSYLFDNSDNLFITNLTNGGGWVFDDVHPQYSISLTKVKKGHKDSLIINTNGPFNSLEEYNNGINNYIKMPVSVLKGYSDDLIMPRLPVEDTNKAVEILGKMVNFTAFSNLDYKPVAELHATHDKKLMIGEETETSLPVRSGDSFNIWVTNTGVSPYMYIERKVAEEHLRKKMKIKEKDPLPFDSPRIVFRGISNYTNNRTFIVSLIDKNALLQNSAPYLSLKTGVDEKAMLALGIMSSIPFDWQSRRFIEMNVNYFLLNPLRLPIGTKYDNAIIDLVKVIVSSYKSVAENIGLAYQELSDKNKKECIEKIDALVLLAYGLDEKESQTIYKTFHRGLVEGEPWKEKWMRVKQYYESFKGESL